MISFCLIEDFDLFSAWFKVYGTVQRTHGNFFANFCHSVKRWAVVLVVLVVVVVVVVLVVVY